MDIKDKILEFMREKAYNPMKTEELFKVLKIKDKAQREEFQNILDEMEREGLIYKTKKKKYGVPERMNLIVGILQGHARGFGFVTPDIGNIETDVYISPEDMNGAMNNDKVIVRLSRKRGEGQKIQGEVIRILKRGNKKIVGTFESSRNFGFVVPDDQRVKQDIYIPKSETMDAHTDDKVVVEITEYPVKGRNPEGRVIEILGNKNEIGTDILSIIRKFDLPEEFPPDVLAQTDRIPDQVREEDRKGRKDLTNKKIITIDGEDAKDLDDAVSIEKLESGNYLLGVHIADVSHYVFENSPIDQEALKRGTSVYLVDRVIPMLPPKLSNGICSLNPHVDRLTLSCIMEINSKGQVENYEIFKSIINSKERMTYKDVTKILEEQDAVLLDRYKELIEDFKLMKELAEILRNKRRMARGAIDFNVPEAKIILNEEGRAIEIQKYERTISHKIIEEFMLVCNETIAQHMYWASFPFIYRVHEEPDSEKLKDFNNFIHNFGYHIHIGDEIYPKELQNLLNKIKGTPEESVISHLALRTMKQAKYSANNLGHFGLAATYYTHFTSPIRRYPDLVIHRIISEMLYNKLNQDRIKKLNHKTPEIASQSSIRERVAEEAERETDDLKKAEYMKEHLGEIFDGMISGVTSFGIFVQLENTIEGLVRVSSMDDDYYQYDEVHYQLIGERTKKNYKIGEKVRVEVVGVDIAQGQINFILVEE
ncbi:ribonuclease R [Garciella nitratireducens]|uniref:Ribonuclease R n=1 Tax=Garciella nitratireducens DSM 15102 TaxID=1121911 RepID=A0A1T4KLT6_9FIRM|nr:ribonuclease R [Garciella nitratireducens]SJZ43337.1 RNAse R [Garciella nitratireducens DSM 15102]